METGGTDGKPIGSLQWWPELVDVEDVQTAVPNAFTLKQNYPNPFNPSTKINYSIPKSGFVTLKVYNILGREVASIFSGQLNPGNYVSTFDGSKFAGGVYIYRLDAGATSISKKLILIK